MTENAVEDVEFLMEKNGKKGCWTYRDTTKEVFRFDLTIALCGVEWTKAKAMVDMALLKLRTKRYVYQLEEGDKTRFKHFQLREHAKIKMRTYTRMLMWKELCPELGGCVTGTSKNTGAQFSYCMKEDTRVEGPWRDGTTNKSVEEEILTMVNHPYPWQELIMDDIKTWSKTNTFNVIVDPFGMAGKSTMALWIQYKGLGIAVPALDAGEMVSYVASYMVQHEGWEPNVVWLDLTRATRKGDMAKLAGGVEQIKTGMVMDKRYKATVVTMRSPKVWVSANSPNILKMWSYKRVRGYLIQDGMLIDYDEDTFIKQVELYEKQKKDEIIGNRVSGMVLDGFLRKFISREFGVLSLIQEYYK